ncbi:MAG: DNA recombination protein RmuC [Candidatus Pacebacteria bacterium]|jgi:DNA recombination protein RmuC|nr:DNA recombination protein RmuC [Candidatus Paceibacterota bacterium]
MQIIWILLGVIAGGLVAYAILGKKRDDSNGAKDQSLLLLQQQMAELARALDSKLTESRRDMQDAVKTQFSESQKLLKDINEQMSRSLVDVAREQTKTNEATTQFIKIAEKLGDLEKTLKHQKQRGNWGEASLELILSNTLAPGQYKMQHEFKNKEVVDAIIVTKEGIIPIDAKFSLDNYDRVVHAISDEQRDELEKEFKNDLKKRIDETSKYVRPEEGTLPFAFMYIPAEAIYYDLLINQVGSVKVNTRNLIDYAYNEKKVIIISPTTFMAYLQSVLYGFKAFKIEESAKEIIKKVEDLGKHLKSYDEYHNKLGNALGTVVNHYNASNKELKKIDKDVLKIAGASPELNLLEVEKPQQDE